MEKSSFFRFLAHVKKALGAAWTLFWRTVAAFYVSLLVGIIAASLLMIPIAILGCPAFFAAAAVYETDIFVIMTGTLVGGLGVAVLAMLATEFSCKKFGLNFDRICEEAAEVNESRPYWME